MKKALIIIPFVILAFLAGYFYPKASKEPIRIGFIGVLTGEGASSYGLAEQNATQMAVEEINEKGGIRGRMIEVIYEDGKCNAKDAVTAMQKLINIDKVKMVLGGVCSAETLGIAPLAEENEVILFTSFSSSPDITGAGDFVFRNCVSDLQGGKDGARMIEEKGLALITENTDYSQGIRKVLKKEFKGEIVADEVYTSGEKDFKTYLTKIKGKNPEALFINAGTSFKDAGLISKQAKELGLNAVLYSNFFAGSDEFLEVAGEAAEGIIFYDAPGLNENNSDSIAFLERYKAKYPSPPSDYQVGARYDAVYITTNALKECGEDTICIRDYLYNVKDYNGMIGKYSFDHNGDITGISFVIKQIVNGKAVLKTD